MAPILTSANVAEISSGAGYPAASPETAAPDANPGYRDAMIAALPSHAVAEKVAPERYEAWRAERLAKIDKDTNYTPPDPAVAAEAARAEAHAIAPDAKPELYQVEWPPAFQEGAKNLGQTAMEMRQLAADLKLPASMGKSLLEHLAFIAPKFRSLNEDQSTAHRVQAEAALRSAFGSQEAADAKVAEARAALAIAKDNKLAAALGQSLQILDPMVIAILVGHAQRYAAFQKGGPK